jgi:hypothetical protein
MAAQGENQRQIAVAKGEEKSRQMEADKVGTQMGMAQSRVTAANEARAAAKADLVGGLSDASWWSGTSLRRHCCWPRSFLKEQVG